MVGRERDEDDPVPLKARRKTIIVVASATFLAARSFSNYDAFRKMVLPEVQSLHVPPPLSPSSALAPDIQPNTSAHFPVTVAVSPQENQVRNNEPIIPQVQTSEPIITRQPTPEHQQRLAANCNESMHQMAVNMVHLSSPKNSSAWTKSRNLLSKYGRFHVFLDSNNKLFEDTTKNVVTMLEGYGLQQIPEPIIVCSAESAKTTIIVEMAAYAAAKAKGRLRQEGDCSNMPKILLQTEQIASQNRVEWNHYLQSCDKRPECFIWDFSDSNLGFLKNELKIENSAAQSPIMFHQRLGTGPAIITPMRERQTDVVMHALMTMRRRGVVETNFDPKRNAAWVVNIGGEYNMTKLKESYSKSRICMIIHSYADESAGEYHRMSEVGPFGCRLVVEDVADNVLRKTLEACGGVTFTKKVNVTDAIGRVLDSTHQNNEDQQRLYTEWWRNGIEWGRLAEDIYGTRGTF